jgi:hypothetical protein
MDTRTPVGAPGMPAMPERIAPLDTSEITSQENARVVYTKVSVEVDVLDELRSIAFELTGNLGRRVTLSEALHILVDKYREKSKFSFLEHSKEE